MANKDTNQLILSHVMDLKESMARVEQRTENMEQKVALGVDAHDRVRKVETTLSTLKSVMMAIPVIGLVISGFLWVASAYQGIQASEMVRK